MDISYDKTTTKTNKRKSILSLTINTSCDCYDPWSWSTNEMKIMRIINLFLTRSESKQQWEWNIRNDRALTWRIDVHSHWLESYKRIRDKAHLSNELERRIGKHQPKNMTAVELLSSKDCNKNELPVLGKLVDSVYNRLHVNLDFDFYRISCARLTKCLAHITEYTIGCVRIYEPLSILVTSRLYFMGLDYFFFKMCVWIYSI